MQWWMLSAALGCERWAACLRSASTDGDFLSLRVQRLWAHEVARRQQERALDLVFFGSAKRKPNGHCLHKPRAEGVWPPFCLVWPEVPYQYMGQPFTQSIERARSHTTLCTSTLGLS